MAEQTNTRCIQNSNPGRSHIVEGSLSLTTTACNGYEERQNQTEHDCQGLLGYSVTSDQLTEGTTMRALRPCLTLQPTKRAQPLTLFLAPKIPASQCSYRPVVCDKAGQYIKLVPLDVRSFLDTPSLAKSTSVLDPGFAMRMRTAP